MNRHRFRLPARRLAAAAAATSLAAVPAVLTGASPAGAAGGSGATGEKRTGGAHAVVLRTGLDVSLIGEGVRLPLALTLDEVSAPQGTGGPAGGAEGVHGEPRSAGRTVLTAQLDGVDKGRPFRVLKAGVATARATTGEGGTESSVRIADAEVRLPGLPGTPLLRVDAVMARAACEAGEAPVTEVTPLTSVTVLGRKVNLTAQGPTAVPVRGIGEVRLDLSKKETTSRTAAVTALQLNVSVDPLDLGVAKVTGTLTLAEATCETPEGVAEEGASEEQVPAEGSAEGSAEDSSSDEGPVEEAAGAPGPRPQAARGDRNLADTGGGSATPYLVGAAGVLLAAGAGGVLVARRRRG